MSAHEVMTAERAVRAFCDRMVERDAESLRPFLADDAVYQNVGMPPARGADAIIADLAAQFASFPDAYEYETVSSMASDNMVMCERLDYVRAPDGKRHGLPVMGTFVLDDDHRITRWTDYWDTGLIAKMMQGDDYAALVPQY